MDSAETRENGRVSYSEVNNPALTKRRPERGTPLSVDLGKVRTSAWATRLLKLAWRGAPDTALRTCGDRTKLGCFVLVLIFDLANVIVNSVDVPINRTEGRLDITEGRLDIGQS